MIITGDHVSARVGNMSPVLVPGVQRWAARGRVKELNGQTAEDEAYENPEAGSRSLEVQIKLVIDIIAGDLISLEEGTVITHLKLFAHTDSTGPIYDLPKALVLEAAPEGEMQGQFTYNVTVKSKGPYTFNNPSALGT